MFKKSMAKIMLLLIPILVLGVGDIYAGLVASSGTYTSVVGGSGNIVDNAPENILDWADIESGVYSSAELLSGAITTSGQYIKNSNYNSDPEYSGISELYYGTYSSGTTQYRGWLLNFHDESISQGTVHDTYSFTDTESGEEYRLNLRSWGGTRNSIVTPEPETYMTLLLVLGAGV